MSLFSREQLDPYHRAFIRHVRRGVKGSHAMDPGIFSRSNLMIEVSGWKENNYSIQASKCYQVNKKLVSIILIRRQKTYRN